MHMPFTLYIASNSASRKILLEQARIPFLVIKQDACESEVSTQDKNLPDIVMQIAQLKMKYAQLPSGVQQGDICFVLTADTLGLTRSGAVLCKPVDRVDAVAMLQAARFGTVTATGFCLHKLQWDQDAWILLQEVIDFDKAESIFSVPDEWVDMYLDAIPFLTVSGAISIEGFGAQFLESVHGSYEAIVGLPIFKVRQALRKLGFYTK